MALLIDSTSNGHSTRGTTENSRTVAHTCASGAKLYVIVSSFNQASGAISGATYDGTAMTEIGTYINSGGNQGHKIYYLSNPTTGSSKNIVVSASGGGAILTVAGVSVLGNDDGYGSPVTGNGQTIQVTTTRPNCIVIESCYGQMGSTNDILIYNSSQTDIVKWNSGNSISNACCYKSVGAIATTNMYIGDFNSFSALAIEIKALSEPTVTTQAVSSIAATTATGNGTVTADGGATITERGTVYSTSANPTTSDIKDTAAGTTGAYTTSIDSLISRTTYHVRAYAINSVGTSYGADVTFTTLGFTTPANIYASDNTYATLAATSGILTVEVSKDAGVNWQTPKTVTFTGSDTLQTVGLGALELFGSSFTRADMVNANFRVRLSQGNISQVYKTFGFSTGTDILTGIEIAIEGNYASSTLSLDLLEVKIHYGTSILPVQAGSQAYASNGRKDGEGAGAGTGVLVYYDGTAWRNPATGATVAA